MNKEIPKCTDTIIEEKENKSTEFSNRAEISTNIIDELKNIENSETRGKISLEEINNL